MEGAYVTRQVSGDKQSIEVARRVADLVLAAHLPQSTRGGTDGRAHFSSSCKHSGVTDE
jgi:hypothetical protein